MVEYLKGDLVTAEREALVNTVNCVGVMGRGVALAFKRRFPANFKAYKTACEWGEVELGRMFVFETHQLALPHYIINFPTKRHWRGRSRMEDIDSGLEALVAEIRRLDVRSIAVPPLGAGLSGLPWNEVRGRIERTLEALSDIRVVVFEPRGAPEHGRGGRAE